jgi:hypothetical protein
VLAGVADCKTDGGAGGDVMPMKEEEEGDGAVALSVWVVLSDGEG